MNNTPLRIGILGCSDIARRKFIPALLDSNLAILAAIGGRDSAQAAAFAAGINCCTMNYEELVANSAVDLIYISLSNHLHDTWVIRALENGKHVICEKPLGLSRRSIEAMLIIAEQKRLLLYENLMFLRHPQHAAVNRCIEEGRIGRIIALRSVFGIPVPATGDFRLDQDRGGGAFHDLNRYPLGTALHFLKGEIQNFQGVSLDKEGLNLAMHGVALTSAHEVFSFSIAFGQQYESFYEIIGDRGKIKVERAYTTPSNLANRVQVTCGHSDNSFVVSPADHFMLTINHVAELIVQGGDFHEEHAYSRRLAGLAEELERGCRKQKLLE